MSEQKRDIVPVHLVGGPEDWDGTTLDIYTTADLAAPREDLGTMLISEHTPAREDDEDLDPRAVYAPDPEPAPAHIWYFRGWFPASIHREEWPRPDPSDYGPVEVTVDGRGVPRGWTDADGRAWRVDRIRVHWEIGADWVQAVDASTQTRRSVWQVTALASTPAAVTGWDLVHDPRAGGWSAAPIPP